MIANGQSFRFGYDSDSDKYGYIVKEADTDVFIPFKNNENLIIQASYGFRVVTDSSGSLNYPKVTLKITKENGEIIYNQTSEGGYVFSPNSAQGNSKTLTYNYQSN